MNALDGTRAGGGTPMWGAISLSIDMLIEKKRELGCDAPMKIIILTDGGSTDSYSSSISTRLRENNIRIDSIVLETYVPDGIYSITKYTGGYIFQPKTMEELEDIVESEPLFDMSICKYNEFKSECTFDEEIHVDNEIFSNTNEIAYSNYKPLSWIIKNYKINEEHLLETEIYELIKTMSNNETMKIRIKNDEIKDWTIFLKLKQYNNLWYALHVVFPEDFPRKNPSIRFINPPYHVNVTKFGRIHYDLKIFDIQHFEDYIKDIQKLLDTPYSQLKQVCNFGKFEAADTEHMRTYSNENEYKRKVNESFANGKTSPEEFC